MIINIISLFPDFFRGPFDSSIIGRAVREEKIGINFVDLRHFGIGKHQKVDDVPYGGGPGMLLMPEPLVSAISSVRNEKSRVIYLSPQGPVLTAEKSRELSLCDNLVIICGHYEGVDNRVLDYVDEEISIGDYVLTNGGPAAIVLVDSIVRLIPGVLGSSESANVDSFEDGLLDFPQYTTPRRFNNIDVPEVLLGGNHGNIKHWRDIERVKKTFQNRPDLYLKYLLSLDNELSNDYSSLNQNTKNCSLSRLSIVLPVTNIDLAKKFYRFVFCNAIWFDDSFVIPEFDFLCCLKKSYKKNEGDTVVSMLFDSRSEFTNVIKKWNKKVKIHLSQENRNNHLFVVCNDFDGNRWSFSVTNNGRAL